jgi:hypothetical protein
VRAVAHPQGPRRPSMVAATERHQGLAQGPTTLPRQGVRTPQDLRRTTRNRATRSSSLPTPPRIRGPPTASRSPLTAMAGILPIPRLVLEATHHLDRTASHHRGISQRVGSWCVNDVTSFVCCYLFRGM